MGAGGSGPMPDRSPYNGTGDSGTEYESGFRTPKVKRQRNSWRPSNPPSEGHTQSDGSAAAM